jgi:antirestriction protein ArdC
MNDNTVPVQAFNHTPYQGYNVLFLEMARATHGYTSNEWASFLDWKKNGYSVKKGEHGVHCRTFIKGETVNATTPNAKTNTNVAIKYFVLFNREQVEKTAEKKCPRCREVLGDYPALSRKDNRTRICSQCATVEALQNHIDHVYH